jgi:hypothetical protein
VEILVNEMITAYYILYFIIFMYLIYCCSLLFFSSLITLNFDVLHTKCLTEWCDKPLQTNPLDNNRQYSRKFAFNKHCLSLSDNFKINIAVLSVWTLHVEIYCISISSIYHISPVSCWQLLWHESCVTIHSQGPGNLGISHK